MGQSCAKLRASFYSFHKSFIIVSLVWTVASLGFYKWKMKITFKMETTSTNEYGDEKIRQPHDMKRTYKIKATSNLKITLKTNSTNEDVLNNRKWSNKKEDDLFLTKHLHTFNLLTFHLNNFLIETFLGIHCQIILSSDHEVTGFSQQGQIMTQSVS